MDQLAQAYASSPLLFWLLGSVLVYGIGTNALWLSRAWGSWRSPVLRLLVQVGRFSYYFGIPYLALGGWPRRPFQGLLAFRDIGLVALSLEWTVSRWLSAVGVGLGMGLVALIVLIVAWENAKRGVNDPGLYFSPRPWWMLLVDGLYLEVHWAFYRGLLALLLDDVYIGIFGGLALVCLEWSLNPFWRHGWRQSSQAAGQWLRAAVALVSAMVFLLTRNLWVCLGVHWMLELSIWHLGRARVPNADLQDARIP